MKRPVARILAAALVATAASCTVADTLEVPDCDGSSSTALIAGQSVPSATLLTCFDDLPSGWEATTVDIGHDGTTVVFDSDRAGLSAARFHYEESCDIGDATATPTNVEGAERFERILEVETRFRALRWYRFDGGCVTWEFDFAPDAPAAMAVELDNSLRFLSRDEVNQQMRDTFVDVDL